MPCPRTRRRIQLNPAARAALAVSGVLISLVGFVLAVGGDLSLEGSALDVLAGLGLIVSGSLLAAKHRRGAWACALAFAGVVSWSLRNIAIAPGAARLIGRSAARERGDGSPAPSSMKLAYVETKGL